MRKLVNWKKLFLLVLCVCMVVSLVACAGGNKDSNNNQAGIDVQVDLGAEVKTPGESVNKVISAITAVVDNKSYLNSGFSGDFNLDFSNNNAVKINMDVRTSVRPESSKDSKFSIVFNQRGDSTHEAKLLLGLYFDGETLKLDNRGLGGKFTVVDTDIVYLLNFISTKLNQSTATAQAFDMDAISGVISTLVGQLVDKDIIKVYEKYIEDGGYQQVSISFNIREVIKFASNALPTIVPDSTEIVKVLNKVYDTLPISSALNLSIGVRGAGNSYELVNGSLKVTSHIINVSGLISDIDFSNQAGNIQKPVNEPKLDSNGHSSEIDYAKIGGFGLDVGLGLKITDGNISIADIDNAIGGILNKLVKDLNANATDDERVDIDFSKNQIHVKESTEVGLRLSAQFQIDIKDNNKTNLLLEIYLDKNDPGHEMGKCDPGEALIQLYYVGRDQAFFLDLTGLGKTETLPNKLKIEKDFDGNRINLTHLFTNEFLDLIIVNGQIDFKPLIALIQNIITPADEAASGVAQSSDADRINDKLLEGSIPLVLDNEGTAQPDVMKIVKVILQELNFDKNSADVLSGISIRLTSNMMKDILHEALLGTDLTTGDVTIFDEVYVGLHVDLAEGLLLDVSAKLDANKYGSDGTTTAGFPEVTLNIHAQIEPFKAFEMERLPQDRDKGGWQILQLVKKTDNSGAIDLLGSLLASIENKKIYLSASVNLKLKVDDSNGPVDVGSIFSNTIGGSLGAALADLQMKTDRIDADYTLTLVANIDLASLLKMDTTVDTMTLIKQILPDQQVMISLESIQNRGSQTQSSEEILSILLAGGKVYVYADALGIPKSVIDINSVLDMIPATGASGPETTEQTNESNTSLLILSILTNIDIITIMQDSLAITLNASFLNVIMKMLLPAFPLDFTVSQIGATIKLKSDTFEVDEASLLNQLEIGLNLATDVAGIYFTGGLAVGGLNIGIVDTEGGRYDVEKVYFKDKDASKFNNPFGNTLVNFGLTGNFKLTASGDYTFLPTEDGSNKFDGEIGSLLNNIGLIIGADNLNVDLTLNLQAALDLSTDINNRSQIALQIVKPKEGIKGEFETILGMYVYNGSVFVEMPILLIKPFKLDFDVAGFVIDLIKGNVSLGASTSENSALATTNGTEEAQALHSLIALTNKGVQAQISSKMLKGLLVTLVGSLSDKTQPNPSIDPRVGDDIIDLIHTLPFDLLAIGNINFDGDKGLLQDLTVNLGVYGGKDLIKLYSEKKDITVPQPGVVGLGITLGPINIGYMDGNDVLDIISKAISYQEFDYVGKVDSIANADINKILKDTVVSLQTNISLSVSSQGKAVVVGDKGNNIELNLNDVVNTLPKLFITLGALNPNGGQQSLVNLHMHLAATVNVGELLAGNYNNAVVLSLGIFTDKFTSYEDCDKIKLVSIIAKPETVNGNTTMSLYIDSNGLTNTTGTKLLEGKIKVDNLDLNDIIGGSSASAQSAYQQASDYPTTITKISNIVDIINNVLNTISLSNKEVAIGLGENILAVVVNLLTNSDGSANVEVLPLTDGSVKLVLKEDKGVYPGLYANVGLKPKGETDPTIELGLGLYDIKLGFSKQGLGFIYGAGFDETSYVPIRELPQISLNLNLGFDVTLKEGLKNINLANIYNSFIGQAQDAIGGFNLENGPGMNGLHLGLVVHGNVGIKDPSSTFLHVRVKAYPTKTAREEDKDLKDTTKGKLFIDAYIYKDMLYVDSDILNINAIKIPNIGINKLIADKLVPIITGVSASSQAGDEIATDEEQNKGGLDLLIGDGEMKIEIGKTFLSELLPMLITSVPAEALNNVVNQLFGSLTLDVNLRTMSATIDLLAIAKDKPTEDNPTEVKPDTSHLVDLTLGLNGLEISSSEQTNDEDIDYLRKNDAKFKLAEHNVLIELGAHLTLDRSKVEYKGNPNVPDARLTPGNIFGQLAGVINGVDAIDKDTRTMLSNVLQSLYIDILAHGTPAEPAGDGDPNNITNLDNGFNVTLNVLVQINLDWANWQHLDLHDSSFRLAISDKAYNLLFDIYVIGENNTLYISAPFLGINNKEATTNIKIVGFNLIELIEESSNSASEDALSTSNDQVKDILDIVDLALGTIAFNPTTTNAEGKEEVFKGIQLGLGVDALKAVGTALGLIPSIDQGLVQGIMGVAGTLKMEDTGIKLKYPDNWDNKDNMTLALKLGIAGLGYVELGLDKYAAGIATYDDLSNTAVALPFEEKDKEGLQQLLHFTKDDAGKYKDISKMQSFQVRVKGTLKAGFSGITTDLSPLLNNVIGSILGILPLQETGMKLYSDIIEEQSLDFEVAVHLDLTAIAEKLQIDFTIFKANKDILLRIYYGDNTLYVKAPGYLNDIMRIEHLDNLFAGLGASAQTGTADPNANNIPKDIAALRLAFGTQSVSVDIVGGIFNILLQVLQGTDIKLNQNVFNELYNKFGIGIELGSLNTENGYYLPDLYAALTIKLEPVTIGLKLQQPEVVVATNASLMPSEPSEVAPQDPSQNKLWNEEGVSVHFKDSVFRIKAEGEIGIEADYTELALNNILKDFGVNESFKFKTEIKDPNKPERKPINLHLGIALDAELCLGDFSKCNIKLTINTKKKDEVTGKIDEKELLAVYITNGSIYLDLENENISLGEIHINKMALDSILDQLNGTMTGQDAAAGSSAIATGQPAVEIEEAIFLLNLIKMRFTAAKDGEGNPTQELGSITAEIGAVVINNIFKMLGFDLLAKGNIAASIRIDMPSSNSKFGIALNVRTNQNSELIKGLGLYVFIGNFEVCKRDSNNNKEWEDGIHPVPDAELAQNAMDLSRLLDQSIHIGLTTNLAMMRSNLVKNEIVDQDGVVKPNDSGNGIIMDTLLTEFFSNVVPWMPEFLAQLDVIDSVDSQGNPDVNAFFTSHAIKLQANVNLGMLINKKTCTVCGLDFTGNEIEYTQDNVCPHCGAPANKTVNREFYLEDIDLALEVVRNKKTGDINSQSSGTVSTEEERLLGIYVQDSEIIFYGEPFGLTNFKISKTSVESIAKTVTSILAGTTSYDGLTAISTAEPNQNPNANGTENTEEAALNVVDLLNNLIRAISVSMYTIRVGVANNILSYVPEITKSLGIDGFPQYGYPEISDDNYIDIGLINDDLKIAPYILINLDMFGINTSIGIKDIDLGIGDASNYNIIPQDIIDKVNSYSELGYENSVININVEAELKLNINKADGQMKDLIGGLLGDIEAGYKVDNTISKNFVLRIKGQIDIADYSLILGVEIVELYDNNDDGIQDYEDIIIGIYYDSADATAYVNTGILSNFKVTGLELDSLLAKLTAEDKALALAGTINNRPILNHDVIAKNSDKPSVKVTLALQQYFAVAVSGELINQILNGIDVYNTVPQLPDFEVGVKIGRELKADATKDSLGKYGPEDYNPFAITLQIGLGKNNLNDKENESGFLIDLSAKVYLGPIGTGNAAIGGTFVNIINKKQTVENDDLRTKYIIIKNKNVPEILHISFDTEGNIKPEVRAEAIKASIALELELGMNKGINEFGYLFEKVFGKTAEITAIAKALQETSLHLKIKLDAMVNINNLILPIITGSNISLEGTRIKLAVNKINELGNEEGVLELTVVGGGAVKKDKVNDAIYLKIYKFDQYNKGTKLDTNIVIDTINIMDLVTGGAASNSEAISTANEKTALATFVNSILKGIHFTGNSKTDNVTLKIEVMPQLLDRVFELIPILMSDSKDDQGMADFNKIWDIVGQLQLPSITDGGLFISLRQNNPEVPNPGVGIAAGLDITFDGMTKVKLGVEINSVKIEDKIAPDDKFATPTDDLSKYTSISELKLNISFEGYAKIKNKDNPEPISLGNLVTNILGLLNMNLGGDVDLNLNTVNTEDIKLNLDGYVDMQDFALTYDSAAQKYVTRGKKESRLQLKLSKDVSVVSNTPDYKTLLNLYLDFNSNSIYVDLTGFNLTKLKITGLDLAQMLGNVLSPFVGGETPVSQATAQSGEQGVKTSKFSALMYLTVSPEMAQLRFNSDLIYGLLNMILGIVKSTNDGSDPNLSNIIDMVGGLELPDFGTIQLQTNKNKEPAFELRINRTANKLTDNYIALGVNRASLATKQSDGKAFTNGESVLAEPKDLNTYANVYDIASGELMLKKVYINASVNIDLDFSDKSNVENDPYTFTRYISRLLSIIINGDEEHTDIYQVLIVGDGTNKKLRYTLNVDGVLDISDLPNSIFSGSDLSVELWKMDMVNSFDGSGNLLKPITNPKETAGRTYNHVMLLGAYLKEDTTNHLPTLYLDLNNLGLPRLKLVGIDSLFGGAASTTTEDESIVLGTGDYAVATAEKKVINEIVVEENNIRIGLNRGFLYGVLEMLMPEVCKDGYINAGAFMIPLPKMNGVELNIDLTNGLSGIGIKAYLEQNTSNYLGLTLNLNGVDLAEKGSSKLDNYQWNNVYDKYYLDGKGNPHNGEKYFGKFGTVHIGTSFAADMLTSIVDSIDPDLLIDYQKRGNAMSYYGNWEHHTTLYDRVKQTSTQDFPGDGATGDDNNTWTIARLGQSWNQIRLTRAPGSAAQNLFLDINTQSGASTIHNNVSVTVAPNATIHANLVGAISLTKGLEGIGALKNIGIPLGAPSIGDMIMPGQSAVATADGDFDPMAGIFGENFALDKFIQGISIRIYTAKEVGKVPPKTVVQVKVDPVTINELFQGVNLLLSNVFNPTEAQTKTREWIGNHPEFIAKALVQFIRTGVNDLLGAALGPNSVLRGPRREFTDFIGALLPLPKLNVDETSIPDTAKMQTTNDQDGNATEKIRSEINITLNYDPNTVKVVGALQSIKAEFGNDYGFNKAPLGNAANAPNAMNQNYYKKGNVNAAKLAVENDLGYVLLNIGASNDKLIGFKSVESINSYNNGGINAIKNKASSYYDIGTQTWVERQDAAVTGITIDDALLAVTDLKTAINDATGGKLPTKANVRYVDGTSTGSASPDQPDTNLPITIVWDDSRIRINANGSSPNGADNYLYGWVQNILIAKIPVYITKETHQYNSILRYNMNNRNEDSGVTLEMIDPNQRIDTLAGDKDNFANMKITLKTYITKNLPDAITFSQGKGNNFEQSTFTTSAVKRIVYKSIEKGYDKEYNTETEEGLTEIYDSAKGRYVKVEQVGWNGDWYYSKDKKTAVAGKLVWDYTNLNWSTSNPFDVNKEVGGPIKTVKMTLITGKYEDFVLDKIQVEVKDFISKEQIIESINHVFGVENNSRDVNVNILENPEFIEIINGISDSTKNKGNGLEIILKDGYRLNIAASEIYFNLKNYYDWKNSSSNKYAGTTINIPVTIAKSVPNKKEPSGMELIELNFNLPVNIERVEFLDAEFVKKKNNSNIIITNNVKLNPYEDFETQLSEILAEDNTMTSHIKLKYRKADGTIAIILLPITFNSKEGENPVSTSNTSNNNSLDMTSDARIKIDVSSMYNRYGTKGANIVVRFLAGTKELGYIEGYAPIEMSRVIIPNEKNLAVDMTGVNVLDANTFTNINGGNNAFKVNIPVRVANVSKDVTFEIVWFDEQALLNAAKQGEKSININAVIGYKQPGETNDTLNNFLNKRVVLRIKNLATITEMRLVSFTDTINNETHDLKINRTTGEYELYGKLKSGVGLITCSYYDGDNNNKIETPSFNKTLVIDINTKKVNVSIGLFNFVINIKDTVTKIVGFKDMNQSRDFTVDADGNYVIKYGFSEKLPYEKSNPTEMTMKVTFVVVDEKGEISNVDIDVVLTRDPNNRKLYKGTVVGPYKDKQGNLCGPYTFNIIVTK